MGTRIAPWAMVALVVTVGHATAGLLPANFAMTAEGGDKYRYTYGVKLQSGGILQSGDYFTIIDFDGFVNGSNTQSAGFSFSSSMSGPTPAGLSPTDDPHIPNLTWTYSGNDSTGPLELGSFTAVSNLNTTGDSAFAAQSHRLVGEQLETDVTQKNVPIPAPCHELPEPSSWVMLAAGIPVVLTFRRLCRRV